MRHLSRLLVGLALFLPFAVPAVSARAEDAPPDPAKDAEKKDEKSIGKDFKLAQQRGIAWRKERAKFWEGKDEAKELSGNDYFWLARHWQEAREYEKSVAAYGKFFDYVVPPEDKKASTNTQLRESARKHLIDVYFRMKAYDKSVAAGMKFLEEFPTSGALGEAWDWIGQAHRIAGAEDKALEAFGKAAEAKYARGMLDFIDVHIAADRVDAAKAALAKYGPDLAEKQKDLVEWTTGMLSALGTDAPGLDKAVSVAPNAAPTAWTQATILFLWGMNTAGFDKKLAAIEVMRRGYADKAVAVGIATYKQYNPKEQKIEKEMTKETEIDWYKKLLEQSPERIPPVVVVDQAFLDAIFTKWDNQITVIDGKGKLRYVRKNEEKPYDYLAVEAALKHMTEAK